MCAWLKPLESSCADHRYGASSRELVDKHVDHPMSRSMSDIRGSQPGVHVLCTPRGTFAYPKGYI